jgi:hypothetical protein
MTNVRSQSWLDEYQYLSDRLDRQTMAITATAAAAAQTPRAQARRPAAHPQRHPLSAASRLCLTTAAQGLWSLGKPFIITSGSGAATAPGRPSAKSCAVAALVALAAHALCGWRLRRRRLRPLGGRPSAHRLAPSPSRAPQRRQSFCDLAQTLDRRAHLRLANETPPLGAPLRSQTRTRRGLDLPLAHRHHAPQSRVILCHAFFRHVLRTFLTI